MTFFGIPALTSVSDMWNYQEILTELRPSLLLELGTYYGGSTLFFAEILKLISPHSLVLTVDLDQSVVAASVRQHERIELLRADTRSSKVATRFKELRQIYPGPAFCIAEVITPRSMYSESSCCCDK